MLEMQRGYFVHRFPRRTESFCCKSCGAENAFTKEKEVDTTMVADMLQMAAVGAFDALVLVSGDADHAPAVEGVRSLGKIVFVSTWGGHGLAPRIRRATFHFYYVAIFTVRENSSANLRFRSSAIAQRKGKSKAKVALDVKIGQGLIGEAASDGERIVVPNVKKDARFRFIESLPETRSEVVIPLKTEGRVLGVLDVQSNQVNAFHANDLLILNALADTIARAIESARLYRDLRRHWDHLALIADVGRSASASLELNTLMKNVSDLIHERFKVPHVHLFTVHRNRRVIEYQAGSGERDAGSVGFAISMDNTLGIIPWVAREGKTVVANDVRKDKRYVSSPFPPENTKSEIF